MPLTCVPPRADPPDSCQPHSRHSPALPAGCCSRTALWGRKPYCRHGPDGRDLVLARWDSATAHGPGWVGNHLRTAVDTYGVCPYILARVSERSGPGKLLVRGSHDATPGKLEQALLSEVCPSSFRLSAPTPSQPVRCFKVSEMGGSCITHWYTMALLKAGFW